MSNNRLIRNDRGRVVRVLETPPRRPRSVARRLNFNDVEMTQRNFFNEIKRVMRTLYPNANITNDVVRTLTTVNVRNFLRRNLTQQEIEWLGTTRRGRANDKPRNVNVYALMQKYGVSPLKRPRENNAVVYYDDTFTPRSPEKVRNKVFLATELNKNGKVVRVYERSALNRLNKKVGPFTRIPFKPSDIKNL